MFAGFADYGVNVNPAKTRLSFEMTTRNGTVLQVREQETVTMAAHMADLTDQTHDQSPLRLMSCPP